MLGIQGVFSPCHVGNGGSNWCISLEKKGEGNISEQFQLAFSIYTKGENWNQEVERFISSQPKESLISDFILVKVCSS